MIERLEAGCGGCWWFYQQGFNCINHFNNIIKPFQTLVTWRGLKTTREPLSPILLLPTPTGSIQNFL